MNELWGEKFGEQTHRPIPPLVFFWRERAVEEIGKKKVEVDKMESPENDWRANLKRKYGACSVVGRGFRIS